MVLTCCLGGKNQSKQASFLPSFLPFPPFHASRFLNYSGRPGFWVLAVRDIHAHWAAVYCMYVCMSVCAASRNFMVQELIHNAGVGLVCC